MNEIDIFESRYKTLAAGIAGRYQYWKPTSRSLCPIIVTLEERCLFDHPKRYDFGPAVE